MSQDGKIELDMHITVLLLLTIPVTVICVITEFQSISAFLSCLCDNAIILFLVFLISFALDLIGTRGESFNIDNKYLALISPPVVIVYNLTQFHLITAFHLSLCRYCFFMILVALFSVFVCAVWANFKGKPKAPTETHL
ncbi:hypothetical protein Ciccas_001118 [Cichlidogyrus casuarinus]|uniref:Uncharacterized protein n=1 Tax=Cichlidogyrus casuarinus TaxID=1844966 RepID=A0ABD2QKY8_9PLAT